MISLGPADGELTTIASAGGNAARDGQSLDLILREWSATIHPDTDGNRVDRVDRVEVSVVVASLEVSRTGVGAHLSGFDRTLIRRTAIKTLRANSEPTATFVSTAVNGGESQFELSGTARIAGNELPVEIQVDVVENPRSWSVVGGLDLLHSDFGISPPAILGSLVATGRVLIRLRTEIKKPPV